MLSALLFSSLVGCTKDEGIETQDDGYGYIQFKLYKEASYEGSKSGDLRSAVTELDYLYDAKRIQITLLYNGTTITQTVALSAYDEHNAEYGLRSEKLLLLSGDYTVVSYNLFDLRDRELYTSTMEPFSVTVPRGGMELYDLTAKAVERGRVRFSFVKDFVESRSNESSALLINSSYAKITLRHSTLAESVTYDSIPLSVYSLYEEQTSYQKMLLSSDSLFTIKAGEWRVTSYSFYNSLRALLHTDIPVNATAFEVADNQVAAPEIKVTVTQEAEYIKDYKALKVIWEALDGQNWSFYGESYPTGANWNFNRDVDLWGFQPGVMLHPNGRVASINLSEFGFRGAMPAEIGQLTQLVELYLGTHNDNNADAFASSLQGMALNGTMASKRMAMARAYLDTRMTHPAERAISPLLRKAYQGAGKEIPCGLTVTQEMIDDQASGGYYERQDQPQMRADVVQGSYCNGLTSLPEEFGNLESLTTLFIANSPIEELPSTMGSLEKLTDMEIYNCPDMVEFPTVIADIPHLVALNVSANPQWSAQECYDGLDALFSSPNIGDLQLLYINGLKLEEIPASMDKASKLSMLMGVTGNIKTVHSMPNFRPVQLFLDYNSIEYLPDDFCDSSDLESISLSNNLLTEMPNMFNKSDIPIASISFANNKINKIRGDNGDGTAGVYKGLSTSSLDLSGNEFVNYPAIFALSGSWIGAMNMSNNLLTGFEKDSFVGDAVWYTESLDLSRNYLTELSDQINGINTPYLYGVDLSYNQFDHIPYGPLNSAYLGIYIFRGQRDSKGNRIFKEWPKGITTHTGLFGLFVGSNDIRAIEDSLSYLVYMLDLSDNPNLIFDASALCPYIEAGYYMLYYDKTQDIRNCSYLGTN